MNASIYRPLIGCRCLILLSIICWLVILLIYFITIKPWPLIVIMNNMTSKVASKLLTSSISSADMRMRSPPKSLLNIHITNENTDVLLLSAYLDPHLKDTVKVIAAGRRKPMPTLYCHWTYGNGTFYQVTDAKVRPIIGHIDVRYDGLYIDCPMTGKVKPSFLAISDNKSITKGLRKFAFTARPATRGAFAACICPMYGNRTRPKRLMAWIEMNRILGVEHFVFYDYSAPSRLRPTFDYYIKKGIVELIDWKLKPLPVDEFQRWPPHKKKIHYFGQFISNNDCIYRLTNKYNYVMFTDLDELLIPTAMNQTLLKLITELDNDALMAFSFRVTYVRRDFAQEKDGHQVEFLRFTRHEKRVLAERVAPKLVVKPHYISKIGVHDVMDTARSGVQYRFIDPHEGLLFHYRDPPAYLKINDTGVSATQVLMFKQRLLTNMKRAEESIGKNNL